VDTNEPKKRGRPPKPKTEDPIIVNGRFTEWENRIFTQFVNNSLFITEEELSRKDDTVALSIGRAVLANMCDKEAKNWIRRSNEDVYDFVLRFNLQTKPEGIS
jgi:hypothetical protein